MHSLKNTILLLSMLVLVVVLTLILRVCSSSVSLSEASPTRAMKGYELYSWQTQEEWYFALVLGTNRIKTYEEISSPELRIQGLKALQEQLDQLPGGEWVFWSAQRVPNTALPPDKVIDEVRTYCRQRGIQLEVEPSVVASEVGIVHASTPGEVAVQTTLVHPTLTPDPGRIPTPYCRPSEAAVNLSASATVLKVGQIVSVTVTLANGDTSDVRLGLIQYSLRVQPSGILTSDNLGPVDHPVSINPGQSDEAEFVLWTAAPGLATFTGVTSFEIHPMDYSWGSWSGCESEPLEIRVIP